MWLQNLHDQLYASKSGLLSFDVSDVLLLWSPDSLGISYTLILEPTLNPGQLRFADEAEKWADAAKEASKATLWAQSTRVSIGCIQYFLVALEGNWLKFIFKHSDDFLKLLQVCLHLIFQESTQCMIISNDSTDTAVILNIRVCQ